MVRVFGGLFIAAGAVVLAVGVLACAEKLLSGSNKRGRRSGQEKAPSVPQPAAASHIAAETKPERNFSIKRTRSEVGFVYWILEGHGKYKCYVLCDSWAEAIETAKSRMAEVDGLLVATPV